MKNLHSLLSNSPRFTMIALAIVVFSLFSRIVNLSFPQNFYFDEVYHGFTATTYLHNDPKGYEYWQTPPEGVAYEWTHPPLAKIFMALGMVLFGENSIGWRVSSVLFGTGIIVLTGILAHMLFQKKTLTLFAMALLSLDNLFLTMSRIAMNDMHFVFFLLLGIIFYIHWKKTIWNTQISLGNTTRFAALTSLALGLSLASKWTALYAGAALCIDIALTIFFRWKFPIQKLLLSLIIAIGVVPLIYLGSYLQFFAQGHTFTQWKETTQQMWWYHTGLKATHTYQSRPWQWLLDLKPVWMHVDYTQASQGKLAHIYNVDNPFLLWFGLIAVGVLTFTLGLRLVRPSIAFILEEKRKKYLLPPWELLFPLGLYFMLWVPWVFSPRIMFFYHYAPAIPFLCILSAFCLYRLQKTQRGTMLTRVVFSVLLVSYLFVYPLNTGLYMPESYFSFVFSMFPMWK